MPRRVQPPRPRGKWITHVDESVRIVSDDLWERAQRRSRPAPDDVRLKAGGKPKYLLSGLLRCGLCDAHYTITDAKSYGCSSYYDGNACSNAIRVRPERVEAVLLGPLNENLGDPDRVARMVAEMEDYYLERLRVIESRAKNSPREHRNYRPASRG